MGYPTATASFPVRVNGNTIQPSDHNDLGDEITAIESALLGGVSQHVKAQGFSFGAYEDKTIASDIITIARGRVRVDTQAAAATDDLATVNVSVPTYGPAIGDGSLLVLQSTSNARVITAKDGTGNLRLVGDFVFTDTDARLVLVYDGTNWTEVARSQSGTAWADYGATSTITGWSVLTTQKIFYRKVGTQVYVKFQIEGTSNATSATFTLPVARSTDAGFSVTFSLAGDIQDNTVPVTTNAYGALSSAASTVTTAVSSVGTGWTAAGTKRIAGQFDYESAS